MANLVPREFWSLPRQNITSLLDEIDNVLSLPQTQVNPISISEDDKHVHIEAALPGVDQEDMEITFDKGMLWIRGEVREDEEDKKRKFYRHATQAFSYRIAVPGNIDPNAPVEAEYRNGVIHITFPKSASNMPQKITVKKGKSNGDKNQPTRLGSTKQEGEKSSTKKSEQ